MEGVVDKRAIVRKTEGSSIYNDKCAKYGISSKTQRRHKFNGNVNDSDLLLLTETQRLRQTDDREIRNNLPYTLQRQDHAFDKFCSLAPCMKSIMFKLDNMNIFQF